MKNVIKERERGKERVRERKREREKEVLPLLHKESIWCHPSLDPWSLLGRGVGSAGKTNGNYGLNV